MPNNRIENLRIVTQRENTHNAHSGKWQARIWINGKLRLIGYFSAPEEAKRPTRSSWRASIALKNKARIGQALCRFNP